MNDNHKNNVAAAPLQSLGLSPNAEHTILRRRVDVVGEGFSEPTASQFGSIALRSVTTHSHGSARVL